MKHTENMFNLSNTITFERHELARIESEMPSYMAKMIANKYVEDNWESIKKDKAFMKEVKRLCIEQTAPKVTELLVKQVSESLGLATK